jgi:hypothetical protein
MANWSKGVALEPTHRIVQDELMTAESPSFADHKRAQRWHTIYYEELGNVEHDKKLLASEPGRSLGYVYASSGYRISDCEYYTQKQTAKWLEVLNLTPFDGTARIASIHYQACKCYVTTE